jgi:hypothetical protein
MAKRGHIVLLREGATAPIQRPNHSVPEMMAEVPRDPAVGRVSGTPCRIPKTILKKSDRAYSRHSGELRCQYGPSDAVLHGRFADSTMPAARTPEPA